MNSTRLILLAAAGSGEFGDVYRAKWHGSFVAAKILKRSDEIALGDFRTEVCVLHSGQQESRFQVYPKRCALTSPFS